MHLVEDSPDAFTLFLNWLYRSTVPSGNSESHLHNLVGLYILADKLCMVSFKDEIMDKIQDMAWKYKLDDTTFVPLIEKLWKSSIPYPGLIHFFNCVIVFAFLNRSESEEDGWRKKAIQKKDMETLWKLSKDNFSALQTSMEIAQFMAVAGVPYCDHRERAGMSKENHCFFHCHEEDWGCYAETPATNETEFIKDVVTTA